MTTSRWSHDPRGSYDHAGRSCGRARGKKIKRSLPCVIIIHKTRTLLHCPHGALSLVPLRRAQQRANQGLPGKPTSRGEGTSQDARRQTASARLLGARTRVALSIYAACCWTQPQPCECAYTLGPSGVPGSRMPVYSQTRGPDEPSYTIHIHFRTALRLGCR